MLLQGLDIYFLNRSPLLHVKHLSELIPAFAQPHNSLTSITHVLRQILQAKQNEIQERKLLIIIATDGQPTDDYGKTDTGSLERVLKHERKSADKILITFCACTDDDQAVGYLSPRTTISFFVWRLCITNIIRPDRYFAKLDQKPVGPRNMQACCSLM
ncbi:unnamed protein product [Rotaria sp. Silwood1]|nr:unnamed protein product [Rotaria sp. Silwood1]CAF3941661.1 unnamed protein product [Rotaria sp. Silwood1]CAF4996024.1 unnamed protein product [Rotaria sp. Silwood1]CAF5028424.1 unnamed protein product [Rotaria sp. Silwood1]CAF5129527.1 unnamed protein product [Rotaria sp. Silwood1]